MRINASGSVHVRIGLAVAMLVGVTAGLRVDVSYVSPLSQFGQSSRMFPNVQQKSSEFDPKTPPR